MTFAGQTMLVVGHRAFYALERLIRQVPLLEVVTSTWHWQPGGPIATRARAASMTVESGVLKRPINGPLPDTARVGTTYPSRNLADILSAAAIPPAAACALRPSSEIIQAARP